jgi:hypothetical protein
MDAYFWFFLGMFTGVSWLFIAKIVRNVKLNLKNKDN